MLNKILTSLFFLLFLFSNLHLSAQDFMMQGWYWDYPKKDCPGGGAVSWANVLQGQVSNISQGGFTYLWLPPPTNASFGQCSNGYDPRDLYDLGDVVPTGLGTRTDLDNLITALNSAGVNAVADVVYNHRDGGDAETNSAVRDYITTHYNASKNPFPSDRFRCILPLGGASGNGAGDYYFKVSSKSADARFDNFAYKIYANTNTVGWQGKTDTLETEPNGGGDCGTPGNATEITLGRNFTANVDYDANGGCIVDEFKLTLAASDFNATGDTLYLHLNNSGGYSDHRIYEIWNANAAADVVGQMEYQTYTNYNNMPSGQGGMNFENFRPNTNTASTEKLDGDWNGLWFFYDYDQDVVSTRTALSDWTKWLATTVKFSGLRMDAVKHFDYAFIGDLMDDLNDNSINPGIVVGEFFDEDASVLNNWITNVENNMNPSTKAAIDVRLFDFSLRQKLKGVCDNNHDARDIFNAGMVAAANSTNMITGSNVITFLNNHDYRKAYEPVWNDQILAYAYLLTNNQIGLPCVFYPEYFGIQPNEHYPNVNLKTQIDELISIHKTYIFGSSAIDHLNRHSTGYHQFFNSGDGSKILIYQMAAGVGGKEIIVAINFGSTDLDMWHAINFDVDDDGTNNYGTGQTFTEVTNNSTSSTLTVFSPNNDVNIKLPAKSYAVWVQGAALPLDLLSFDVKTKTESVELNWKTANEVNLKHFEIERSLDGNTFDKIGLQKAKGFGFYQFTDKNVPINTKLFYRLRMVDTDGQFDYSKIKSARLTSITNQLKITPNPASDILNIHFETKTGNPLTVKFIDTLGKIVKIENFTTANTEQNLNVDISDLSKGLYLIQISKEGVNIGVSKFIKE